MIVLNVCVNGIYTDGYTYHENLLPKYHKSLGYEVHILASQYEFSSDGSVVKSTKTNYIDENGVHIHRLPIWWNLGINSKFKIFKGFMKEIETIHPDIIFCHLFQFLNAFELVKYKKKHSEVSIYVDSHADYINSARTIISMNLLHRGVWRLCAHRLYEICEKFYGVLPVRVEFLKKVYALPDEKVELLIMGVDDIEAERAERVDIKCKTRERYGVSANKFLIVTGGKITGAKPEIITLVKSMSYIDAQLIVFGPIDSEIRNDFMTACCSNTKHVGWLSETEAYDLFAIADLVVFPSTHSVYWEQVAGQGIPMIIRKWEGIDQLDLGGNIRYLSGISIENMVEDINAVVNNPEVYRSMKENAWMKGRKYFSYRSIAERSIQKD